MRQKRQTIENRTKLKIVEEYLNTRITFGELAKKYGIKNRQAIHRWKETYLLKGPSVFLNDVIYEELGFKDEQLKDEELKSITEEVQKLKQENFLLKKRSELVEKRVASLLKSSTNKKKISDSTKLQSNMSQKFQSK